MRTDMTRISFVMTVGSGDWTMDLCIIRRKLCICNALLDAKEINGGE